MVTEQSELESQEQEDKVDESVLVFHAIRREKDSKDYLVYVVQVEEDPPEFLPTSVYIGKHLGEIKKVIIELEEKVV